MDMIVRTWGQNEEDVELKLGEAGKHAGGLID
jgi:hypothetical protein